MGGSGGGRGAEVKGEKKAREDRVNEMASKDELNGGRKETRSDLSLLTDSSQTGSFQRPRCSKAQIPQLSSLKGFKCGAYERGAALGGNRVCVGVQMCAQKGHSSFSHTPRPLNGEVRDLHTDGGSEVVGITRLR